ncbi:long-chain fatty acid--CoA ligase [Nocardioides mesophilus]|uniref:Long-chain fatty acid--CoA ligase n=1 Tax=Nocardioides mesophilus TaxID=433659 RepID=A0A7G9RGM7_9ACTN|nr:long-chain fatty acid--CoA ligase [Nocardioides mesophilus]
MDLRNLTDAVVQHAERRPDKVAFRVRDVDEWTGVTSRQFAERVRRVAAGLLAQGVRPGDRVALMCSTRFEWTVIDYAVWWVGAVSVPIYANASAEQVRSILSDSGCSAAMVETEQQHALFSEIRGDVASLERLWCLANDGLEALEQSGETVDAAELEARRRDATHDSLASIVYTSGTTGAPRGCRLTHGNFLAEAASTRQVLADVFTDQASTLLFLPLPHIFARVVQVAAVGAQVTLGHRNGLGELARELPHFRPTFLLAVPRVFEQLYNSAAQHAAADGHGRRFQQASATAIAFSRALDNGRVGPVLRARHLLFERLVYPSLRETLGGSCQYGISGGAPLGDRLAHLYRGIGIPVLEGYGLTETTAAATLTSPATIKIGSVGQPLPGTTVRVASDGELMVRGPQVMSGYWEDPDGTAEVLDPDGWFRTGDVGEIDDEGFVRVTGRKQEILVTASGKVISPEPLEDRLRAHSLVSQAMVVGDGRPYLAALITLDREAAAAWAEEHHLAVRQLPGDDALRAELQSAVDAVNESASPAESIRAFQVLERDWTEAGGELTASLKLRRDIVARRQHREIERLFTS